MARRSPQLSEREREQLQRYLNWAEVPTEFKRDMLDYIATNAIPHVSNIPSLKGEEWRNVNAAGGAAPAFNTNWSNTGGILADASFYKDVLGMVHMRGHPQKSTAPSVLDTIFTLPEGYRPSASEFFVNLGNDAGTIAGCIKVNADGTVQWLFGGGAGDLIGIAANFRAAKQ